MRKPILFLTALLFFSIYLLAQNSMTGDGFGGRGWYVPHNYSVGAYSAYTVCGDSNQLYGWGSNLKGQLGNGTRISTVGPVAAIGMKNVKLYTTGYVSAAIKYDSTAWVWGSDYLSHPSGFTSIPAQVLNNVVFVDAGIDHVVLIKNDSTVWGVGGNKGGELGNGTTSNVPITTPVQMTGINNAVRGVAVGATFETLGASIILLADSTVKITGGGGYFQPNNSTIPVTLPGLNHIVDIKGCTYAAFALDNSGNVYSFGTNFYGELGMGIEFAYCRPPTKITFPQSAAPIVALSANNDGFFCLALDSNRNVYGWGANQYGQLGDGTVQGRTRPVLVATNAIDIFAGETFSYILKADNTLWATGLSGHEAPSGSIWMNLSNDWRFTHTQIDPTIAPMNLCAPKVWGVVPIKLSNFSCTANGNTAYLNWLSAEETNASKYIVQYSNDGSNFKDIATVFATGSNSKYNYIHQQVSGTAFYRLKMIDKDGSFKYSEIRSIKFANKNGFTIAPNPADDVVYVFTKDNAIIKSIQIISIDGQVVKAINHYNAGQGIYISNLAKGTYILKTVYKNNEIEYGRFIKM